MHHDDLHWHCARFDELRPQDLYDALQLRARVFILEQACAYLDPDGVDPHCAHVGARAADGTLVAYLRIVDPGVKYAEPSIGRVITDASRRGTGLGHVLVARGLSLCELAWPGRGVRISAQAHLQGFYATHGFVAVGEPYLEDGIPHMEMLKPGSIAD